MAFKPILHSRSYAQKFPQNFFNIIVSGGGIIGQTMVCALSKNSLFDRFNILLIESNQKQKYVSGVNYSNRVSTLSPSSKKMLENVGMWKHITRSRIVKDMKVWGNHSNDYINFVNDTECSAYVVENNEIINAAEVEIEKAPNVKVIYGTKIKTVNIGLEGVNRSQLELTDDSFYDTNLLIGADGGNSFIRNAMQSDYINWSYNQLGIVATLVLAENNENFTAWQRFLPEGPVAVLPLDGTTSSLVWSVSSRKAKELMQLPEDAFLEELNNALHSKSQVNDVVNVVNGCSKTLLELLNLKYSTMPVTPPYISSIVQKSMAAFPLGFGHSSEYFKTGVVLIGDSAHKVHPLAGQGINIGFRDIRTLEAKLSQGLRDGRELGHDIDLRHYETEAQRQNVPLMAAIDALHWIYTSHNTFMKAFGNMSFRITESITPLKKIMKNLTM